MKYFTTVLFFLLIGSLQSISAQQSADNHKSIDYALELNDRTLEELATEKWTCQDRLCLEEQGYWNRTVTFSLEFTGGNNYTIISQKGSFKGEFDISEDQQFISFSIPKEKQEELDGTITGTYKVTKLTYDRMIMTSIVKNTDDIPHILRFVTDGYLEQVKSFDRSKHVPRKFNIEDYSEEDQMRFTIQKIEKVASSKNVELPANMENLTLSELNEVLKQILE